MKYTSMEKTASRGQGRVGCKPLTTFVQTDTSSFREVVQRLTGPGESNPAQETVASVVARVKRSTSKLRERRHYSRPKLEIVKPPLSFKPLTSPTTLRIPSFLPSPMGSPSKIFSKLSIQELENKGESAICVINSEEEEKAINERRFYLHPSPRSRRGHAEPELLTLFPLTSPKTTDKP